MNKIQNLKKCNRDQPKNKVSGVCCCHYVDCYLTVGFSRLHKDCPMLLCVVCNAVVEVAYKMKLHTVTKSL